MKTREKRVPSAKRASDYATCHIVVKPETRNRIVYLMEGKRFTDQLVYNAIAAYGAFRSGAMSPRYAPRYVGLGCIHRFIFSGIEIEVKIDVNPVTGEEELFFNIDGFERVLGCGKRLRKYIHTKNEKIKARYNGTYLESGDDEPVWYNANGIFLIFQQMRMNIPIKERKMVCDTMYGCICFCASIIIGTPDQYEIIDTVKVFEADW